MTIETPPSAPQQDTVENAIELKEVEGLSQGQIVRRRFFRHRGAIGGLIALALLMLLAYSSVGLWFIPGWWEYGPNQLNEVTNPGGAPTLSMPTWLGGSGFAVGEHPFGQDEIGRDIFARTMKGVQTSLNVMFIIGFVSSVVGMTIGSLAGFFRGWTDQTLMRFTDLVLTFPVIVIGAVLGNMVTENGAPGPDHLDHARPAGARRVPHPARA
jgi:peptide/nickel transport system permease protein